MTTLAGLTLASTIPLAGLNADITLDSLPQGTDITTNNVTSSKHGLCPKLPADATKYLDGTGAYTVPAGGGGGAMTQIFDSTLSSAAASFDITSISGSYAQLKLVLYLRSDRAGAQTDTVIVRFNNDSGTNYYSETSQGQGAIPSAFEVLGATAFQAGSCPAATATASYFGQIDGMIANYAGAVGFKTMTAVNGYSVGTPTNSQVTRTSFCEYTSTTAISRVTVLSFNGANFIAGSRCTLYGLA